MNKARLGSLSPPTPAALQFCGLFCANKLVWEENSMGQNTTKHKTAQTQSWGRQGPSDLPEAKCFKKDQRRESAPEWAA